MTLGMDSEAQSNSRKGILLMSLAMLSIPLVDGLAKYLSADYSPLFVSWARYVVACLIVVPMVFVTRGPRIFPSRRLGAHTLRTVFLVTSMTLYFMSIAMIPLATAVSAYFVAPIIAVVLSLVFLKEQISTRKVLSLVLGFGGAMVILRPTGDIEVGILLAFGAGLFFALYMIATRQASQQSDPLKTLAFQCVMGAVLLAPQGIWTWSTPQIDDLIFFAGLGAFSVISHLLSIRAFGYTDASTLAPLVYLELVATAAIGYIFFTEVPGLATIIGASFIVIGGLVLLKR